MLSHKRVSQLLIGVVLVVAVAIGAGSAQNCRKTPDDCDASQVLADLSIVYVRVSSSQSPDKLCEQYARTSLSEDGNTAQYNYTYIKPGQDETPIYDTATIVATSNTVLKFTVGTDPSNVIENELFFINGAFCNVAHTSADDKPFLLYDNPDSPLEEYLKCVDKIREYSNETITFVRNPFTCAKIPEKP